jgi:hypothetical protein
MGKNFRSERSKFTLLENHLLNTFYSGLYISAQEFIEIGQKVDLHLTMNTREYIIKELLNKSFDSGTISQTMALLIKKIDERTQEYHALSLSYNGTHTVMARLAQKANGTKALLARESRGNPYE